MVGSRPDLRPRARRDRERGPLRLDALDRERVRRGPALRSAVSLVDVSSLPVSWESAGRRLLHAWRRVRRARTELSIDLRRGGETRADTATLGGPLARTRDPS